MTTYKYCTHCDQTVVFDPPQPLIGDAAIVFPAVCLGGNSHHFCKQNGYSTHDVWKCDCLRKGGT
jgi:hypothetical protein